MPTSSAPSRSERDASCALHPQRGRSRPGRARPAERAASRASLRATFVDCAPRLTPAAKGTDAGLARLLAIVARSGADGSWDRLKACAGPDCRWAFYDKSRNRSGRWCSMATCGNLHKTRAFRERAKASET